MRWRPQILVASAAVAAWIVAAVLPLSNPLTADVDLYEVVARRMADGQMPYRDFFLEYPPGAAIAFWLARLVPAPYPVAFSALACLALVVTALAAMAVARRLGYGRHRQVAVGLMVAVMPLALGRFIAAERFDVLVSLSIALMLACAVHRRFGWAWAVLGVAVLVKFVPLLLVPVMVMWQRRAKPGTLARDAGIGAGVVVAGMAPFVMLAPRGIWDLVHYHLARPLQIESLGASYMRGIAVLTDRPMPASYGYGSHNLTGDAAGVISGLTTAAQLAGIVAIAVTCHVLRTRDERVFVSAVAATLALVVVTAKVLSPQFVLWLIPACLLVAGPYARLASVTTLAVAVVTQLEFPHAYLALVDGDPPAVGLLVVRNLLLIMLVAACWPRRVQDPMLKGTMPTARPSGPASITAP